MALLFNGVGLGTFPFAGPFSELAETPETVLAAFLDAGGKYIDTAPTYDYGSVEELLGKELRKRPRDSFFLNTSCGYVLDSSGEKFVVSGRREDVIADCEASLRRLGFDHIDLYISHIPDLEVPFAETVGALEELRDSGKIRQIGVSNVSLDQLKEYNAAGAISYIQNRFSYLNRSFSPEFADYCVANNVGLVAYQVIERGMLTDKGREVFALREGDLRNVKSEFASDVRTRIARWVTDSVIPIADDAGVPLAALAVWWAHQQPFVAMCQFGATSVAQLDDTLAVLDMRPDRQPLLQRLEAAYEALSSELASDGAGSVRDFLGLSAYSFYSGSATGKGVAPPQS